MRTGEVAGVRAHLREGVWVGVFGGEAAGGVPASFSTSSPPDTAGKEGGEYKRQHSEEEHKGQSE